MRAQRMPTDGAGARGDNRSSMNPMHKEAA
jgi:hypothetical protein